MHLRYLALLVAALATSIGCNCCGYGTCCSAPMECSSCVGGDVIYQDVGSSCPSCQASAGAVYHGAPVTTSPCANGQCNANRGAAPGAYTTHYAGQYYNGAQPRSGCPNGQCNGGGGNASATPTPTPSPAAPSGAGETVDDFLPSVLSN